MPLSQGFKLGPYEIVERAGAGGMGEVYKAHDTRLDRTVAVKILPSGLTMSEEARARFEREAKAISSLNHPAICTLHDIGREGEIDYLVMEFIEGETLAQKLKAGPLPVVEAIEIGVQVAEALDAAHQKGLVHRDLKPGNIMLTADGAKLLDFGLAKMQQTTPGVEDETAETQTTPLTGKATVVGTVQYMSPEQVEGSEADFRSDIFAFGGVLYEMLTGRRAFQGSSQTGLIASILKEQPEPVSSSDSSIPPLLDRVVRKCLDKNPEARWQSARDLADELRWIADPTSSQTQSSTPGARSGVLTSWLIAAAAIIAAAVVFYFLAQTEVPERRVRRLVMPAQGAASAHWPRLSPDGRHVAYRAINSTDEMCIWIRPLNSLQAYPLPGTVNAGRPFWSPDSREIAFFQNDVLKRMPISGGRGQVICKFPNGADGSWGSQNVILFDGVGVGNEIMQVPAGGGTPTSVHELSENERTHAWPWVLPDGRRFLYLTFDSLSTPNRNMILRIGSLESDLNRDLMRVDSRVEYTEPGYIVYVRDSILLAQRFDPDNGSLEGEPFPIDEGISVWNWGANFSLANDGTLAFQTGSVRWNRNVLVWFDRAGRPLDTVGQPDLYRDIALSPDNSRLVFTKIDARQNTEDVWVYDLDRNVPTRLTFDTARDIYPGWSPDGGHVFFTSGRNGKYQIFRKRSDGSGEAELIYENPYEFRGVGLGTFTSDGNMYIFGRPDTWTFSQLDLSDPSRATNFHDADYSQYTLSASPDGRFLAVATNESGDWEVYVQEAGEAGGKWQISTDGGTDAVWSSDGSEIFYMQNARTIMAVRTHTENGFRADLPTPLFTHNIITAGPKRLRYAPSRDGQRFLINTRLYDQEMSDFVIVLNWLSDIDKE